jgi:hypothetical protein
MKINAAQKVDKLTTWLLLYYKPKIYKTSTRSTA